MKRKIWFSIIIYFLPSVVFGGSPLYRDQFYIENRTEDELIVVFESIGQSGAYIDYYYDDTNCVSLSFDSYSNASEARFRTIVSEKMFQIGFSQYDYQPFNQLTPMEKFSAFFKIIFLFNKVGDLMYRIDNFSNMRIVDKTEEGPGIYVLIIE
jgi:hypothetical protein